MAWQPVQLCGNSEINNIKGVGVVQLKCIDVMLVPLNKNTQYNLPATHAY